MKKIPFKKFIFSYLLFNKDIEHISSKLKAFDYFIGDDEISELFTELRYMLPESLKEKTEDLILFKIDDEKDKEWLKKLEVYEFYNFLLNRKNDDYEKPAYFKWFEDCLWILNHKDTMAIVNIFLFNEEPLESISGIISYKYKKKISQDALNLYVKYFWDTVDMTAKEAIYHCLAFRDNTLIVNHIKAGNSTVVEKLDCHTSGDGSDTSFVFHDSNYIKWKIGYKEIEVPRIKDFMQEIKKDSYYKYYETMNMAQSIEIDEEEGSNDKIGGFSNKRTRKRNVEEQKVKNVKQWMDMYIKADKAIPAERDSSDKDFFDQISTLELQFDNEKLADIKESPEIWDDIKGDVQK